MPVNRPYPLAKLMAAVDAYAGKDQPQGLLQYLLLKGINDTPAQAEALYELLKHNFQLFHVNLIKYHDTQAFDGSTRTIASPSWACCRILGVPVTHRITFGEDIDAACGQLAR